MLAEERLDVGFRRGGREGVEESLGTTAFVSLFDYVSLIRAAFAFQLPHQHRLCYRVVFITRCLCGGGPRPRQLRRSTSAHQ